jgi:membrane protein YdbS with pleckstrin-like domain
LNGPVEKRHTRPTVYESAVDSWIVAMLLFTPVLAAGLGVYMLLDGQHGDAMIFFIAAIATLLVTSAFIAPCRYTILDDALSVRCGIIYYQVPLGEIENVEPSGTWRSGPALSMRRVLITTRKRYVVISPRERDEFIADLCDAIARCKKP